MRRGDEGVLVAMVGRLRATGWEGERWCAKILVCLDGFCVVDMGQRGLGEHGVVSDMLYCCVHVL